MTISRAETIILAILEVIGLGTCGYGLYFQYAENIPTVAVLYCCVWYFLGAISHLLGLISISLENPDDELQGDSQTVLQYHYLTAWLAVILGYPLMVNYTWLMLYPTFLAYLHLLLSIIPVITWLGQSSNGIVYTTQVCTTIAAVSHFIICFMHGDLWGWTSAVVMIVNVIALSTPTKYHVWVFNSRELFIIGLVATSVLMNFSIVALNKKTKGKK